VFPGHYKWGLMGCLAPELTREALWHAFTHRHVYGVTGDRVNLAFRVNGALMGSCIDSRGPRTLDISVSGSDALDRIEVLRNGRVIHTHCHQGTWRVPQTGRRSRFKLRVEAGWGPYVNEVTDLTPRHWDGLLTLGGGARFTAFEPCWTHAGQQRPVLAGSRATFVVLSPPLDAGELAITRAHNGNVFEFEAQTNDALTLGVNDLHYDGTVAELCQGSRVLLHDGECRTMLKSRFGLDVETFERPTYASLLAHKVKLHRIIPEAGYTATFQITDDEPLDGEANYRIRVEQRNGQKAWSSPVWVQPTSR